MEVSHVGDIRGCREHLEQWRRRWAAWTIFLLGVSEDSPPELLPYLAEVAVGSAPSFQQGRLNGHQSEDHEGRHGRLPRSPCSGRT